MKTLVRLCFFIKFSSQLKFMKTLIKHQIILMKFFLCIKAKLYIEYIAINIAEFLTTFRPHSFSSPGYGHVYGISRALNPLTFIFFSQCYLINEFSMIYHPSSTYLPLSFSFQYSHLMQPYPVLNQVITISFSSLSVPYSVIFCSYSLTLTSSDICTHLIVLRMALYSIL